LNCASQDDQRLDGRSEKEAVAISPHDFAHSMCGANNEDKLVPSASLDVAHAICTFSKNSFGLR
jgi:hypothetical protein